MHRKSLAINEELGRKEGMASDYGNLGWIQQERGKLDQARKLWEQAQDLYAQIGISQSVEQVQGWLNELDDDTNSNDDPPDGGVFWCAANWDAG
jgi:protein O-GlcNAc transferase